MWLVILIVLAGVAFVVAKVVLSKSQPPGNPGTGSLPGTVAPPDSPAASPPVGSPLSEPSTQEQSHRNTPVAAEPAAPDLEDAQALAHAHGVNTGKQSGDVREMIKMLNLRPADASRLGISKDEFTELASGSTDSLSDQQIGSVYGRLANLLS